MKIINQPNISFKSNPLAHVNIHNAKTGELVPAIFSELSYKNDIDIEGIEEIYAKWDTPLSNLLCSDFPKMHSNQYFYAIELPNNAPLSQKIIGLASTEQDFYSDSLSLSIIVTEPSLAQKGNSKRLFKNTGEVLFAMAVERAKKAVVSSLYWDSANNRFYNRILKKAGIPISDCRFNEDKDAYILNNKYFDKYLDYIKTEYKIDFSG